VPDGQKTIQAAIDAAQPGDTVQVAAGGYLERISLRPGIIVRSAGDDTKGKVGLKRAEDTILDGGGENGDKSGVVMAEGSTLDGFTITNVGAFDEALWRKHHDSHGEELADDEGSVQAEGTIPAISIRVVNCTVTNNIVHHNGDVGIAVTRSDDSLHSRRRIDADVQRLRPLLLGRAFVHGSDRVPKQPVKIVQPLGQPFSSIPRVSMRPPCVLPVGYSVARKRIPRKMSRCVSISV